MIKKYEFTGESKISNSITLNRIRRISDCKLGGWIESQKNLSHEGDCFVYDNGRVFGDAHVSGDARVFGDAHVSGDARVYGKAEVYHNAQVLGDARVSGDAKVFGDAHVSGHAKVYDNAQVFDNARVSGNAHIHNYVMLRSNDTIRNSKSVMSIRMVPFNMTVTPQNIHIGCASKSRFGKDQWKQVTKEEAEKMGLPEDRYHVYKTTIKSMIKAVARSKT
jgi:carbonic anhydrase/acetyltransferase-like protein (isoleucine patch superfamily)